MPVIVLRHAIVDTATLELTDAGRAYAQNLAARLQSAVPDIISAKRLGGFYADPAGGLVNPTYHRCFETITPLAEIANYSIDAVDGAGVAAFAYVSQFFTGPTKFGVLCLRLEDGINPLRASLKLKDWDSPCAYGYLAILTPDASRPGGWQWRSVATNQNQPPLPLPCASDTPPR